MARRKPVQHDESGLDEFHPDTTRNPAPVGDVPALPDLRPGGDRRVRHAGRPVEDRRQARRG